jgi:hypothetical protein
MGVVGMWGKSTRGDGVFDMRRFCISPNCPQLMSKSERNEAACFIDSDMRLELLICTCAYSNVVAYGHR